MDVVISTSSLNSYGTRVLTSGIDISQYKRNPILLWMHRRPVYNDSPLPIGKVENLRIDGDKLIGSLLFDETDDFAKKIKQKWEGGFLNMVSIGASVIELSESPEDLLQGQTRMTIKKCKLEEISVVDIGANDEALRLYDNGGNVINLSKDENNNIPLITLKNEKEMNEEILKELSLSKGASDKDVINAISEMKSQIEASQKENEEMQNSMISYMIDNAINEKRIDASKKEQFMDLGKKAGIESLKLTLSSIPKGKSLSAEIEKSPTKVENAKKFSQMSRDELLEMRENNKEEYIKLYKAEYGLDIKL